jgi:hypothetical protein
VESCPQRQMVVSHQLFFWAPLSQRKRSNYSLNRRVVGRRGEKKTTALPGTEPGTSSLKSVVTPTEVAPWCKISIRISTEWGAVKKNSLVIVLRHQEDGTDHVQPKPWRLLLLVLSLLLLLLWCVKFRRENMNVRSVSNRRTIFTWRT